MSQSGKKPRALMTPDERRRARKRDLESKRLRDAGTPVRMPVGPVADHVRYLIDVLGMSAEDIGQQAGVAPHTVRGIRRGARPTCNRDIGEAILGCVYRPRKRDVDLGAYMSSVGVRRRLNALALEGFSGQSLAEMLGLTQEAVSQWYRRDQVSARTVDKVRALYSKLEGVKPEDLGINRASIGRARVVAEKRGAVPRENWDDDTIDDPNGFPEWTGACGTEEGYRIHIRETVFNHNPLPLCDACKSVVETMPVIPAKPVFRPERFRELLDERGINPRQLALYSWGDIQMSDSLYRWRSGERNPASLAQVEPVANALGVPVSELLDEEAMSRDIAARSSVGGGSFNPYTLRVVLNIAGMSFREAANASEDAFSPGAVSKWCRGKMRPASPDKLKPLADHFGVDVDIFYS